MVLRKKGSTEPSSVRVYHSSVEWDLLSIPSEVTPYSFEAEVFFQSNFEYMSIAVHWYFNRMALYSMSETHRRALGDKERCVRWQLKFRAITARKDDLMVALWCFHSFHFSDYARQISQWKVIPEGSVEGQASRGDARYLSSNSVIFVFPSTERRILRNWNSLFVCLFVCL